MRRTKRTHKTKVRAHKPSRARPAPVTAAEQRGYDSYDRSDYGYALHGFDELGRLPDGYAIELDPILLFANDPS